MLNKCMILLYEQLGTLFIFLAGGRHFPNIPALEETHLDCMHACSKPCPRNVPEKTSVMGLQAGAPGGACKIYVLDIAEIAAEHGLPSCDVGNVVVDSKTQVRCRMAATPIMISLGPLQLLTSQLHEQAQYPVSSGANIL